MEDNAINTCKIPSNSTDRHLARPSYSYVLVSTRLQLDATNGTWKLATWTDLCGGTRSFWPDHLLVLFSRVESSKSESELDGKLIIPPGQLSFLASE